MGATLMSGCTPPPDGPGRRRHDDEGGDILDGVEALYFAGDSTWMTVEDALTGARPEGRVLLDALWDKGPPAVVLMEDAMGGEAAGRWF